MSSFVTTTRHDTESTYAIDTFFHASNYSSPTQQSSDPHSKVVVTSSPTSQSNSMTYDCLPQQGTTSAVSTIPIENLSIQHSIANEWMSPLGYTEYNQPDMNFLFTYNELVIENKDISPSTKLGSTPQSPITKDSNQQTPVKPAEQYRRFSIMDINNGGSRPDNDTSNYSFIPSQQKVVGSSPFIDFNHNQSLFQQQQHMMSVNTSLQKERASMPDVFAPQHPTVTNDDYLQQQQQQQQQQHHHQQQQQQEQTGVSWNQHGLLSRRPVCTTPIKEEEEVLNQGLTKYNYMAQPNNYCTPPSNFNQSILSSTSSPLKKHAKKRSIIEEVLHQDVSYSMPSVVPSVSEPIPTTSNWMQHHRKRTKSIRENNSHQEPVESMSSLSTGSNNLDDVQHHHLMDEKYMINDVVPGSSCDNNEFEMTNGNNQLLAAMPRRQKLRYEGDNYTPKWVRYTGHLKEGYCDSCNPGKWLQLKNSAYWYHKQFYHGISSVSGKSFMKPLEQRMGKGDMIEGLCHQCHRFVPACNGKKKNNYMLWYRHAHKCHLYDKPKSTLKTMRKLSITTSSIPK